MPVAKRDDSDYEIEAVSKALAVLETLEDGPVKRSRIEQRTRFNRDLVMRTLRTLRLRGYVMELPTGEWTFGPRFVRLAQDAGRRA
jgi:DNA-binding IclR family transcriptional regulator